MAGSGTGSITNDGIERLRARVGYVAASQISGPVPFNRVASVDGFRHFSEGYGDDNPLYCDPDRADGSVFGGPVAPPTFLATMGEPRGPKAPSEIVRRADKALGAVQAFQAGGTWEALTLRSAPVTDWRPPTSSLTSRTSAARSVVDGRSSCTTVRCGGGSTTVRSSGSTTCGT